MERTAGRSFGEQVRHAAVVALERLRAAGLMGPILALACEIVIFGSLAPRFATTRNFLLIAEQAMEIATLAIGQTLIILVAGIDLANGVVMVLASIVMAKLAVAGVPVVLAVVAGVAVSAAFGLAEGLLVAIVELPPFIVTLGFFNVAMALALLISGEASIINLPPALLALGDTVSVGGTDVPVGILVMLAVLLVTWYALRETAWGRHMYALGDNLPAARLSGIRVNRVLISAYVTAGIIYAVAALLLLGRTTVGNPDAGETANLESITAAVIGGISLFGGRGSIVGPVLGAFIVGALENGLTIIGVDALYQDIAIGLLVIAAVILDRLQRGRSR
ncbi:MAG TPA: ABC transporter permease [Acetobacteraceae bacterium]|nr:ABC transporter permease [Acetobacteraceae bacterium]